MHKWEGAERKAEAGSRLSREPKAGLEPRTLRSQPNLKSDALLTEPLRSPGTLPLYFIPPEEYRKVIDHERYATLVPIKYLCCHT